MNLELQVNLVDQEKQEKLEMKDLLAHLVKTVPKVLLEAEDQLEILDPQAYLVNQD